MQTESARFFIPAAGIALVIAGTYLFSRGAVAQERRGYELEITSSAADIKPGQSVRVKYKVKGQRGQQLKDFATVHESIMHLLLVRKDLQMFQHLHPDYDQGSGEFAVDIVFPTAGPYRMFPDFTPAKSANNPQLLPVTLTHDFVVGDISRYQAQPVIPDAAAKKMFDGYEVGYTFPQQLQAKSNVEYSLTISRSGQAVKDLQTYLGALGHSVILKADTLDFIHTHAESGKEMGPKITFATSFPTPGTYKTFTQFRHQGKVLTTDHVISVVPGKAEPTPAGQPSHGGAH